VHFFFEVEVPHNTTKNAPHTEILPLSYGVITDVFFHLPRGSVGLLGFNLLYHDHQMYPANPGGWYRGNETTILFGEYQPITVNPYELKARAYNFDDTFDHSFFVGLAMQRPEEMGREIPAVSLAALQDLIGTEIPED